MAPISVVTLLCLLAVQTLVAPSSACHINLMTSCSNNPLLASILYVDITLFQPTNNLDQLCRQVQDGLGCLTGPGVLGGCDAPGDGNTYRQLFRSWQGAVLIPCSTARDAYLLGAECWDSQAAAVKAAMKVCFNTNRRNITKDYCTGQRQFMECTQRGIEELPGCSVRESSLYAAMAATGYNTMAPLMECDPMDIPSWTTTPVPTTTIITSTSTSETASTTVQAKPEPEVSSRQLKTTTSGIGQGSKSGGRRTGALFSLCVAALSVFVVLQLSDV